MKLTEKQKRFCEEYLIDLNATQAAIRAGYSSKTANRIAAQNLSKLDIQNYISELRNNQSNRTGITADTVLKELEKIALTDTEISGKEKMRALELLGKHFGMFSGETNNSFVDDNVRKEVERLVKAVNENDTKTGG